MPPASVLGRVWNPLLWTQQGPGTISAGVITPLLSRFAHPPPPARLIESVRTLLDEMV